MFPWKKKIKELEKRIDEQDERINELFHYLVKTNGDLNEIKKNKHEYLG